MLYFNNRKESVFLCLSIGGAKDCSISNTSVVRVFRQTNKHNFSLLFILLPTPPSN